MVFDSESQILLPLRRHRHSLVLQFLDRRQSLPNAENASCSLLLLPFGWMLIHLFFVVVVGTKLSTCNLFSLQAIRAIVCLRVFVSEVTEAFVHFGCGSGGDGDGNICWMAKLTTTGAASSWPFFRFVLLFLRVFVYYFGRGLLQSSKCSSSRNVSEPISVRKEFTISFWSTVSVWMVCLRVGKCRWLPLFQCRSD